MLFLHNLFEKERSLRKYFFLLFLHILVILQLVSQAIFILGYFLTFTNIFGFPRGPLPITFLEGYNF